MQTIRFIKMLEMLAKMSKGKYVSFNDFPYVIDDKENNVIYVENDSADKYTEGYRIPLDVRADELHHDIISYFDDYADMPFNYTVRVKFTEENEPYIEVVGDDECIIIENGEWYFAL